MLIARATTDLLSAILWHAAFVAEAGTTEQDFLAEAKGATGMQEMYLQIFLAHAEYNVFIELMIEKARSLADQS